MAALTKLADGLWEVTDVIRMPGGIRLPVRTTVLRDRDGGIVLYSPLRVDDAAAAAIDELGEVRHLVGPNLYHHLYLRHAKERWPHAELLAAPGLESKRANLSFDDTLEDGFISPGVASRVVRGMPKINETVLVHAPSRTLVCSDLTFRIREASGVSKLAFKVLGDYGQTLQCSRIWKWGIKDRGAYRESMDALLEEDFDGVVMAHGDPVLEGGKAQLRNIVGS